MGLSDLLKDGYNDCVSAWKGLGKRAYAETLYKRPFDGPTGSNSIPLGARKSTRGTDSAPFTAPTVSNNVPPGTTRGSTHSTDDVPKRHKSGDTTPGCIPARDADDVHLPETTSEADEKRNNSVTGDEGSGDHAAGFRKKQKTEHLTPRRSAGDICKSLSGRSSISPATPVSNLDGPHGQDLKRKDYAKPSASSNQESAVRANVAVNGEERVGVLPKSSRKLADLVEHSTFGASVEFQEMVEKLPEDGFSKIAGRMLMPGDFFQTPHEKGHTSTARRKTRWHLVLRRRGRHLITATSFTHQGWGMKGVSKQRRSEYVRYMGEPNCCRTDHRGGLGPHPPLKLSKGDPADEAMLYVAEPDIVHETEWIRLLDYELLPDELARAIDLANSFSMIEDAESEVDTLEENTLISPDTPSFSFKLGDKPKRKTAADLEVDSDGLLLAFPQYQASSMLTGLTKDWALNDV